MNILAILGTLLFSFKVQAYPIPQNFCYGGCSTFQEEIWNKYEASDSFDETRTSQMYSGACYHLSSSYNSSHPHYAGVLIDRNANGELTFSGRFSFFAANDYANWDLERARSEFPKRHLMTVGVNEAFLDLNPGGEHIWYYWLRDHKESDNLILIASWSIHHQVFCELIPNQGER